MMHKTIDNYMDFQTNAMQPIQPSSTAERSANAVAYAGFWLRLAAHLIDFVITIIALFTVTIPLALITGNGSVPFLDLFFFVAVWLYYALMESSSNQGTLGKMIVGIKVTDMQGSRIGFGRATARRFAKMVSTFSFGVGYIMAGFTQKKQALHDLLVETLVVRKG